MILRNSSFIKKKTIKNPEYKAETGLYGSAKNDFDLIIPYDADIVKGDILTSIGTEWGGRIFDVEIDGSTMTLRGKTFRGQMELVSPNPFSVLTLTGTDYEIIKGLIDKTPLLYDVKETGNTVKKTITIPANSNLLKAVDLVLNVFNETMKIAVYSKVEISLNYASVHRYDYSQNELRLIENGMLPTALHVTGKVNGTDTNVSMFLQGDGTVGTSRFFNNFDAYEISENLSDDCTSKAELQNLVSARLLALRSSPLASEVDIKIDNAEIGDTVNVSVKIRESGDKERIQAFEGTVIARKGSGVAETFSDFLGTKGGIRLQYGGDFKVYTTKDGKLYDYTPEYESTPMFQNEINAFVDCVQTGKKLASHIDRNILTSKLMQGIYDSSDAGVEIKF